MALILPNTIANLTPADGAKVQQNFATIQSWANQEAISRDGSTAMTSPLLLPGSPTQPNQAATKGYVDSNVPVGVMWEYAGDTAPTNWMLAQGQALSRATYAALFAVLGTKYGAGDGSTTFNIPSMQGRSPMGYYPGGGWAATLGAQLGSQDATLPSHIHGGADHLHNIQGGTGYMSADHHHNMGEVYTATGDPVDNANVFGITIGQGYQINMRKVPSWNYGVDANHYHAQQGQTSGSDRSLNTAAAGVAPTNANIPPSTVVNFIIRVQ